MNVLAHIANKIGLQQIIRSKLTVTGLPRVYFVRLKILKNNLNS
jgi:hypothetical protein